MTDEMRLPSRERPLEPLFFLLPACVLILHVGTAGGYGYFRDELYYLACAAHPAAGYVDHPAFSILVLKAWTALFGTSLLSLRFLPGLAGAATVGLVGLIARRFGGGRPAQQMAMLAAAVAPMELGIVNFYSMNAFDQVFWALAAWLLAGLLLEETPSPRGWALLGVVLGLGLENKISVLWLGGGIFAGLLLGGRHRLLATVGPWLAGGIAAALFVPYVFWNVANGLPTLEFMRNATTGKMQHKSPGAFLGEQILVMNPVALPLWLGGLAWLLASPRGRRFRPLGVAFVAVALLLAFSGTSRANYLSPAYAWLFAAGGLALAELRPAFRGIATAALAAALVLSGALLAPLVLPILPVDGYVRYAKRLGLQPSTDEKKEIGDLPQHWADRQGWPEIVDAFESAWKTLTPAEQKVASLFASDYGVAGAVDLLGPARGLPKAISGHNNYWLWGPGAASGEVVIVHGSSEERLTSLFESVELHGRVACGRCMPYENGLPIWICRRARVPLARLWPETKNFS